MKKFSKITGLIAFWTRVIAFFITILVIIFQKQIIKIFHAPTLDVTVFLFDEVFIRCILLVIVGLFYYKKNTNNRNRAIISLYSYLLVTILFSNPVVSSISVMLTGMKNAEYIAAKSIIYSALQSISYIFTLASNVCFYLSTGTLIVFNDNDNQNNEIDVSEKNRTKLVLYSGFLGIFGIDRFYAKRIGIGVFKLILGLPIEITLIRTVFNLISNGFSDFLAAFLMNFPYAFALNQSGSLLPPIILMIIPYLPIAIFSITDFVLCVLGKIRDADKKLITKW
jgi:TM2 domain-containing membrane protein YozV